MESSQGYLARSWAMLTAEKGWYKPLLVFAAVCCIPVVGNILGSLVLLGYALEWARLTAWGIDSVPKQRGLKIGELLGSGWRGFTVALVWALAAQFVIQLLRSMLKLIGLGGLSGIFELLSIAVGAFAIVAALRAAIYRKFSAGFGVSQLWEMIRRDTSGFFRIFGIRVLGLAITTAVATIFGSILMLGNLGAFFDAFEPVLDAIRYDYFTDYEAAELVRNLLDLLVTLTPALVITSFATFFVSNAASLVSYNAAGLWMRQFDVPAWGGQADPLPEPKEPADPFGGPEPEL